VYKYSCALGGSVGLKTVLDSGVSEEQAGQSASRGVVRAAVAGATGYTGGELISILLRHPAVRITRLLRESSRFPSIEVPIQRVRELPACEQGPAARFAPTPTSYLATPTRRDDTVPSSSSAVWPGPERPSPRTLRRIRAGTDLSTVPGRHSKPSTAHRNFILSRSAARLVANPGATTCQLSLAPLLMRRWWTLARNCR
jgi:hypothetical protein